MSLSENLSGSFACDTISSMRILSIAKRRSERTTDEMLKLVEPSLYHEEAVMRYRVDFLETGEIPIGGAPLLEELDYSLWLRLAHCDLSVSKKAAGWVQSTTLLGIREEDDYNCVGSTILCILTSRGLRRD